MKNLLSIVGLLLLLTSCEFRNIEIKGTAPGMENATVSIGGSGNILFAENIVDGKFTIAQQPLESSGYYRLSVTASGNENRRMRQLYEVYLEPGKYNVAIDTSAKPRYPIITSSSAIQNDLTIYHRFTDSVIRDIKGEANKWISKLNAPEAMALPDKEYQDILAKVKIWQDKSDASVATTLNEFVSKYPNNKVIPRAMNSMGLESKAQIYYAIYQKLGNEVKNSDEGKKLGNKLKTLSKLLPGAVAPELEGVTPNGKKISVKDLHTKLVIVGFWRSGSSMARDEHFAFVHNFFPTMDKKKVGAIGISFDTDKAKWMESIKKHELDFPQISDLKGDDSPNVKNWNITMLPVYYILDGTTGKIIYPYLTYQAMTISIEEYFRAHP